MKNTSSLPIQQLLNQHPLEQDSTSHHINPLKYYDGSLQQEKAGYGIYAPRTRCIALVGPAKGVICLIGVRNQS